MTNGQEQVRLRNWQVAMNSVEGRIGERERARRERECAKLRKGKRNHGGVLLVRIVPPFRRVATPAAQKWCRGANVMYVQMMCGRTVTADTTCTQLVMCTRVERRGGRESDRCCITGCNNRVKVGIVVKSEQDGRGTSRENEKQSSCVRA